MLYCSGEVTVLILLLTLFCSTQAHWGPMGVHTLLVMSLQGSGWEGVIRCLEACGETVQAYLGYAALSRGPGQGGTC